MRLHSLQLDQTLEVRARGYRIHQRLGTQTEGRRQLNVVGREDQDSVDGVGLLLLHLRLQLLLVLLQDIGAHLVAILLVAHLAGSGSMLRRLLALNLGLLHLDRDWSVRLRLLTAVVVLVLGRWRCGKSSALIGSHQL